MNTRQDRFSDKITGTPPSGIRKFFELIQGRDDIISLGVGEPDFSTPWVVREEAFYHLEKGHTSYTSNWGLLELREEIAKYGNFAQSNEAKIKEEIDKSMNHHIKGRADIHAGCR